MAEKHFNYASYTALLAVINQFVQDNDITDSIRIEIAVPHESFRIIDSGVREDLEQTSEEPAKETFEITYDEKLSALIVDQTEIEIKSEKQEDNNG